jgi:medium-chain acyl-[acyl-carrier-protein] hydrolase
LDLNNRGYDMEKKTTVSSSKNRADVPEIDAAGNRLETAYPIRSYESDASGRLSILSVCNFLQDSASRHAERLGVSVQRLRCEDVTWVLSRLLLKMETYPGPEETVRVVTWPSGGDRLFAFRDFYLMDSSGRQLGAAVSAWLVIDMGKRRPVRIEPFIARLNPIIGAHAIPFDLEKLPALSGETEQARYPVRFRDLDVNQHVNNVSYIEWVLESLPRRRYEQGALTTLEINFLGEAVAGDTVTAFYRPLEGGGTGFLHRITRASDGQELARARTRWAVSP